MKIKLVILSILFLLVGCDNKISIKPPERSHDIIGTITEAKIIKKQERLRPLRYVITVEKNGEKIDLNASTEEVFNAIKEGSVVTVKYSEDFYIEEIHLPNMEDDKNENEY